MDLEELQKKFPDIFESYSTFLADFPQKQRHSLCALLNSIESSEPQTLDEADRLYRILDTLKSYAAFMQRALANHVHLSVIQTFLSEQITPEGMSHAIDLFNLSHFSYNTQHFKTFKILSDLFENPLCQTIFDARLRTFSDYDDPSEPLNFDEADNIINQLISLRDQEARVRAFFDYFASFRPYPSSQRYFRAIKAADIIPRFNTRNASDFDHMKYEIASHIESEDLCSTRTYDDLMQEIRDALNQHLKRTPGFFDHSRPSIASNHAVADRYTPSG